MIPLLAAMGLGLGSLWGVGRAKQLSEEEAIAKNSLMASRIFGNPGYEMAGPTQPGQGPLMSQGYGLFGGEFTPPQAASMLMNLDKTHADLGKAILTDYYKKPDVWKQPGSVFEYGTGEGMRQKGYFGPNGDLIPIGQAYKPSTSSTTINMPPSDTAMKINDIKAFTNDQGMHPEWAIGMTPSEFSKDPRAKDYHMMSTLGEKNTVSESKVLGMLDQYENMLFGPTGIYNDYGKWFNESPVAQQLGISGNETFTKLAETFKNNYELWAQNDTRVNTYTSFVEGTMAPIVRSMGDVGALNTDDIKRARSLLAQITGMNIDKPETARAKMKELRTLMTRGDNAMTGMNIKNKQKYPNAPEIGTVMEGLTYLGGDPYSESSWKESE